MLRVLLYCGIFVIGTVISEEENEIDFTHIMPRVFLKSDVKWRSPLNDISPEIDSREHGVSPGRKQTSCRCGVANRQSQGRIVGGREYSQSEYPYLAAVSYSTNPMRPHCGSVIITPRHFMTAAHCTERAINGVTLFVTVGDHARGRTPGAYTIGVKTLIQHKEYDTNTLKNDISLLYLENNLVMTGAIGYACFPAPGLDITGKYVRAIGWGATRFKGAMTFRPQKVDLRVIDTQDCHRVWPINVMKSPKKQICTQSKKRTTCQGDSGGPVLWLDPDTNRYTIVGLVSAGPACTDDRPSVHTSVADYVPWIMKGIKDTAPSMLPCTKV